jgi:hypothetical protein
MNITKSNTLIDRIRKPIINRGKKFNNNFSRKGYLKKILEKILLYLVFILIFIGVGKFINYSDPIYFGIIVWTTWLAIILIIKHFSGDYNIKLSSNISYHKRLWNIKFWFAWFFSTIFIFMGLYIFDYINNGIFDNLHLLLFVGLINFLFLKVSEDILFYIVKYH